MAGGGFPRLEVLNVFAGNPAVRGEGAGSLFEAVGQGALPR
jgi:hypothetical protein